MQDAAGESHFNLRRGGSARAWRVPILRCILEPEDGQQRIVLHPGLRPTIGTMTYVLKRVAVELGYAAVADKSYSVTAGQTVTDAVIKVVAKDASLKVNFVDSDGKAASLSYANISLFDTEQGGL